MKECKNQTCTRPSKATYCCRRCQVVAGRNVGHKVGLPDLRVGMDLERAVKAAAEAEHMSVAEWLIDLIEMELM